MFRKPLSQYSDDELRAEIKRHVDQQVRESKSLDYKQEVSLDSVEDRREVAKDISSFANEIGGAVIYGIAEDRQSEEIAVPRDFDGMDPIPDFEARVEDLCADTIAPRLPDLQIGKVDAGRPGRVVYVVRHPTSWMAPHMVQGYREKRYYRRGELRAVPMDEHEVRQRYLQSQAVMNRASQFLESREVNFYGDLSDDVVTHFVCMPLMLVPDRVDPSAASVKNWLAEHRAFTYAWSPSFYGVRSSADTAEVAERVRAGGIADRYCEVHRNGSVNYFAEAPFRDENKTKVSMLDVLKRLGDFLGFCGQLYEQIGYYEPVRLRVRMLRCDGVRLFLMGHGHFEPEDPRTKVALRSGSDFQVDIQDAGHRLVDNPKGVLKTMADTVYQAFGIPEADCFEPDMSFKTVWRTKF